MTLNFKNIAESDEFFAISGCDAYFKSEFCPSHIKPMLSRVSRALVQISCFFISAKYHFGRSTTDLLMRMTTTTATTTVTAACRRCRWLKYT